MAATNIMSDVELMRDQTGTLTARPLYGIRNCSLEYLRAR